MRTISIILFSLILNFNAVSNKKADNIQSDSLKLKISQMLIFGIGDLQKVLESDSMLDAYSKNYLGGIILFEKNINKKRGKHHLKILIDEVQRISQIPSFVAIDEEGGKVNRLKPEYGFHQTKSAKYLGQLNNLDSTYYYAKLTSSLLKELGINVNFAPTVDLALNLENPVIYKYERSYGKNPEKVHFHALKFIKAHNENNIITAIKHFPGHGSSSTDTHKEVTDVSKSWIIEELFPYQKLIDEGVVTGIMSSHVVNSQLDDSMLPATLSKKTLTSILREFLSYKGVVFSDDMQMSAITKYYGLENSIIMAINGGIDVLLFSNNQTAKNKVSPDQIISLIEKNIEDGNISMLRINESFRRIIKLKKKINLID